jgi:hypothetical protein
LQARVVGVASAVVCAVAASAAFVGQRDRPSSCWASSSAPSCSWRSISPRPARKRALVGVALTFQSWPQWVSFVIAIGAIVFRPVIIVGVILLYVMR